MSEWQTVRLGDLAQVKHGFAFEGEFFVEEDTGDVLVTPGNFAIGGGFKADKLKFYRGPVPDDFVLKPGELIITMTDLSKAADTLGYGALVPAIPRRRLLHNQRIGRVALTRPDLVSTEFLHWVSRTSGYRNEILGSASGSTVKHTAPSRIEAYRFRLPPPAEQRAIARILGALDDKIELNRQMNETLEALARALFQSWFVDFDPVRAKMRGEQPVGMDATAALFPSQLVQTEHGEVPEGWTIGTLNDLSALNPESWSRSTIPHEIFYVDLSATKWGVIEEATRFARDEAPSRAQRILQPGDTIVGTVRPANGSYALVCEDGLTGSSGFAVFRPNLNARAYVYAAATSPLNIERLSHLADGGAYPAVRADIVANTSCALPTSSLLAAYEGQAGRLLDRAASNRLESKTLAATRDLLLPRLLSGELRVPDAERLVAEAV